MLIDIALAVYGAITIVLITAELKKYIKFTWIKESEYTLKLGYNILHIPIIVDMKKMPHLLIVGLSNSGKSKIAEYALRGKDCVLLNVFREDYKSLKSRRIIGNDKILKYLQNTLDNIYYRDKPFFILIDEILVLSKDKKINAAIQDLLSIARHYNIFLLCISQAGQKECVSYKHLFNCRLCMRMVNSADYSVVLGVTPENTNLVQRQFYLLADDLYKGTSYLLKD